VEVDALQPAEVEVGRQDLQPLELTGEVADGALERVALPWGQRLHDAQDVLAVDGVDELVDRALGAALVAADREGGEHSRADEGGDADDEPHDGERAPAGRHRLGDGQRFGGRLTAALLDREVRALNSVPITRVLVIGHASTAFGPSPASCRRPAQPIRPRYWPTVPPRRGPARRARRC